jgi:hypothetical protein
LLRYKNVASAILITLQATVTPQFHQLFLKYMPKYDNSTSAVVYVHTSDSAVSSGFEVDVESYYRSLIYTTRPWTLVHGSKSTMGFENGVE